MSDRRSIEVPGFGHGQNPIPAASRVANVIATGGISGMDPATGKIPADGKEQCRLMFHNLRRIIEAAGAGVEDIVKVTVWVRNQDVRAHVNPLWVELFPDPHARPARHTMQYEHLPAAMLIQCEALAVVR
jgi:2-iminobutanoate/2-iminopropanoate deaminase